MLTVLLFVGKVAEVACQETALHGAIPLHMYSSL